MTDVPCSMQVVIVTFDHVATLKFDSGYKCVGVCSYRSSTISSTIVFSAMTSLLRLMQDTQRLHVGGTIMKVASQNCGPEESIEVLALPPSLLEVPCDDMALSQEMITYVEEPIKLIGPMFRCLMAADAFGKDWRSAGPLSFQPARAEDTAWVAPWRVEHAKNAFLHRGRYQAALQITKLNLFEVKKKSANYPKITCGSPLLLESACDGGVYFHSQGWFFLCTSMCSAM